jgi:hypothetical protein
MANPRVDAPRLVTYGVGRFGTAIARLALERGWSVVAAYNRAGPKVGQDLGALLGLDDDLGVVVEDTDRADFSGIDADLGVVTVSDTLTTNLPAYRRLLGAGLDVICLGGEATYPQSVDEALAAEIDDLARAHGVTFTGASVWDAYRIWPVLTLAGACTDLRSLVHTSLTLVDHFGPDAARGVGVGMDGAAFAREGDGNGRSLYCVFMHLVLGALGLDVVEVWERREPVVHDEPVRSAALDRVVEAGESIGTRFIIDVATAEGVTARAELDARLGRPGEVEHMSWTVDGDPPASLRLERRDSLHATAACVINRVRDVMAAPPGLVTVDRLGPMKFSHRGGLP